MACPVCGDATIATVSRGKLPTLQNRVYDTAGEARAARFGTLDLQACTRCGYAYNAAFDPAIMLYDEHYDNSVPSDVFLAYYREIATYLRAKYLPAGGLVVDAGCGKGTFLKVMTSLFSDVRGLGIDPACEERDSERLTFITDVFQSAYLTERPALVICRHTLEHIPDPVAFLQTLREPLPAGTPVFIEVPDAAWIVRNGAFWDFCYEHVNYFNPESASLTMARAGIAPLAHRRAFGDQYLWLEGAVGSGPFTTSSNFARELAGYAHGEHALIGRMRQTLLEHRQAGASIAVWGMATKGTEFIELIDPDGTLVDHCIDINTRKQGRYTPLTARRIDPPTAIQGLPRCVVVVMNPNYINEIRATCAQLGVDAELISA